MNLNDRERNKYRLLATIAVLLMLMLVIHNITVINSAKLTFIRIAALLSTDTVVAAIYYFFVIPVLFVLDGKTKYPEIQKWAVRKPGQFLLLKINSTISEYAKETTKEQEFKLLKNKAAFMELRSQINPHFLYNTLEAIRSEALDQNAPDVAKMTKTLSEYYRYNIGTYREVVSLREELRNIINYVKIQQYRFDDKFSLEIFIKEEDSDCFNYQILKLTLQPIVENSIYHAFELSSKKGLLKISAAITKKNMIITISDNGCGIDDLTLEKITNSLSDDSGSQLQNAASETGSIHSGTGIALANVNNRIKLYFGDEYGLVIRSVKNIGTDVEITLPIVSASSSGDML